MIKIFVCDDNKEITNSIKDYLIQINDLYKEKFIVDVAFSSINLIDRLEKGQYYDIYYLDIQMDGLDGIDLAKEIRNKDENAIIIFVSSFTSYLLKLFDVQPLNFILKPINWKKFRSVFDLAYNKISKKQNRNYFFFMSNRIITRLPIDEIIMFEKIKRQVVIITNSQRYPTNLTLKEIYNDIKNKDFIFTSKSDIVNIKYIYQIYPEYILLYNNKKVFVSKRKEKEVKDKFRLIWKEEIGFGTDI